eukprot:SRR837773.8498.p1 GENE.SRR837773.8498~~SRR837773.8498.p1  ORF type:complete len:404 (+),score=49.52 SRR837773.8498:127-1212(+)
MAAESGHYFLLAAIVLKGICDFLHDMLLLYHRDALADKVAVASVTVLAGCVMIAFRWFAGIAQVVEAHDSTHDCTCYYARREILVLCGFVVPLGLLHHLTTRCKNTLKAMTYGSYLFFFNENVPIRFLRANTEHRHIRSLGGSLLVSELVGDSPPDRSKLMTHDTFLDGWVPEWPHPRDLPRTVSQALSTICWKSFLMVILPIVAELVCLFVALRKALQSDQHFKALEYVELGGTVTLQMATVMVLLCSASRLATLEAQMSIYLVWLQKWAVWMTQSPLIPLLYVRGVNYFAQYMGFELHTTPHVAHTIAKLCGFAVLAAALVFILHNYIDFHKGAKRTRPVLLEVVTTPSEVALIVKGSP